MDRASIAGLGRQPGYAVFYAGATLARMANEMFGVAVVLLVLDRTENPALAGATLASVTLPSFISGPLLGAWFDLTGRRRTLMLVNQSLMVLTVALLLVFTGVAPGWSLPLFGIVAGITYPLSFGGFTSLIPTLVPEELLTPANALEASSFNAALILGPALSGTIAAFASPAAALTTEIVLTLAALGLIARVPALDRIDHAGGEHDAASRSLLSVARAGLGQIAAVPALRGVTFCGALNLGGFGLLTVAFPFFAADVLGGARSDAGYMWAAFAAGSTLGALLLVRFQDRLPSERVVLAGVGGAGVVMLLWPLAPSLAVALALIALAGFCDGPGLSATFAVRQQWVPRRLHGQVFTTAASLKVGCFSLGAGLAGPVVVAVGASGALVLAGLMQLLAVVGGAALMRLPARAAALAS